ncbi:hypothetical protein PPL_03047 [Heterostelium album PN500]|uniref:Guanylyl cyclase n=1 Tax=Heterostelium pallidum (strain ATCC 26659 / Pp 5 / PN500) TaxID=670386 RepID=D3B3S6_HETP5|nr:hypothetical protein PPL_03047 [Heterostelium album PN500]EFA83974.1 hypothetical protein PPL_03047 [Heterostelium album PN500]|eukprot:XP_020436091.1 hypothetical protein PPL_03047 [Heterostelium album PN500]
MNLINKDIIAAEDDIVIDNDYLINRNINIVDNIKNEENATTTTIKLDNIKHIQQKFEWDCGLACLDIILDWWQHQSTSNSSEVELLTTTATAVDIDTENNNNNNNNNDNDMVPDLQEDDENSIDTIVSIRNIIKTKSIWSIDLSEALYTIGIRHCYFTTSIGMNETHKHKPFYVDNWDSDENRILDLFNLSKERQPPHLFFGGLAINELIKHIKKQLPAIVLVDSNFLHCSRCRTINGINSSSSSNNNNNNNDNNINNKNDNNKKTKYTDNNLQKQFKRQQEENQNRNFNGHFIVIAGYDQLSNELLFIDPSLNQDYCKITLNDFEYARSRPEIIALSIISK